MDKKQKNPHRTQAISWRDGSEKEEVVNILNSPEVDKHIPEAFKWYQGHNSAGKRVLWACREIKRLARLGYLEETKPMFGKPEEVEGLEERIRQLETLEVDYVKTINDQIREGKEREQLLAFYRKVVADNGIIVDEDSRKYKGKYDDYWTVPAV